MSDNPLMAKVTGPLFPIRQGDNNFFRREVLKEIARLASFGSATCLYRLQRMNAQDRADVRTFSPQIVKDRLKAMGIDYGS